jgi:hypothetical protein
MTALIVIWAILIGGLAEEALAFERVLELLQEVA